MIRVDRAQEVLCNIATIVEITERSACCHDEADLMTRDFAIFWNFKN